ncbi:hypothetical protein E2A64_17085 [Pseudohoeflea suaedae]|uniref:Probable alginate O-acetylase AlgI n=1 Tax=Pseudohoeflea suaedae TaxID=877384 RepID=A0A4R5PHS2_9HYPH|nr:MBOAT family O-acyltransferase [Pseudohoeflea suaedae]TDH34382.1 hypothetical protein E2A64_17085 [Pseudohoeflea suaedae]
MLFSSNSFLLVFLPLFLAVYFIGRSIQVRNVVLLVFSLLFYAWGEPTFILVLALTIVVNWLLTPAIARQNRLALTAAVTWNLGVLVLAKYTDFLISSFNGLAGTSIAETGVALPLGVSFFCFQAVSFAVDVFRGDARAETSLMRVALYITMFPQLVAGPIVRYATVANQLTRRFHTLARGSTGFRIFMIGLAQKVVLANEIGRAADVAFALGPRLDAAEAWLGLGSYTLQIYYDFAGYSNMAIGLGLICGFTFPRNFRQPYTSRSITEFWRRWHMSLSRWFRDYLYIPLGGNRRGDARTVFNLMTVFLLCGFWHGAAWNFIVWGGYFGLFLLFERFLAKRALAGMPVFVAQAYTLLVVMAGWVFFRSSDLGQAGEYFAALAGAPGDGGFDEEMTRAVMPFWYLAAAAGSWFALVPATAGRRMVASISTRLARAVPGGWAGEANVRHFFEGTTALFFFALAVVLLQASDYNPSSISGSRSMILRIQRWLFILIGAILILGPALPVFLSPHALPSLLSDPPHSFPAFTESVDKLAATHVGGEGFLLEAAKHVRFLSDTKSDLPAVEGKNGWLFFNSKKLRNRAAGILVGDAKVKDWERRAEALYAEQQARGGRLIVVPAPDKATIYPEMAPYSIRADASESLDVFLRAMADRGIPALDLRPVLLDQRERGALYGPVDTHWNQRAALLAYNAIVDRLGEGDALIPPTNHFKGYRRALIEGDLTRMLQRGAQEADVPEFTGGLFGTERFVRTEAIAGLPLPQGAYGLINPGSAGSGGDSVSVLIIGDSFSNSFLTPLFARNFDRVIWLHHSNERLDAALMNELAPDIVVLEFVERLLE